MAAPWWAVPAAQGRELILTAGQADDLRHLLDALVSATRKGAER